MQIVRFDDEVSVPLTEAGSLGKAGALVRVDDSATVTVLHLPAGGGIVRQPAVAARLLGLIAGSGWVSGSDGRRRRILAGYGARWEAGEEYEVGSEDGLTAVCVDGTFESLATAVTQVIEVVDSDPLWPDWFEHVRAYVAPVVDDLAVRVEHVGSTSVPGLAAKPVIDMDIVVRSEADVPPVIERLARLGYDWRGDLGVVGRQAFSPPTGADLPRHHLYLVVENTKAHIDHWLLRETLAADPVVRGHYAELKRRNQELADGDMDFYVAAKAAFVADVLRRARADRGLPEEEYWEPVVEAPPHD